MASSNIICGSNDDFFFCLLLLFGLGFETDDDESSSEPGEVSVELAVLFWRFRERLKPFVA